MSCRPLFSLAAGLMTLSAAALIAQGSVKRPPTSKPETEAKRGTDPRAKPTLFDDKGLVIGADHNVHGAGGKFGGRRGGRRRLRARKPGVALAIGSGLKWLRHHQDKDGGWDAAGFMRHDKQGRKSNAPGESLRRVGITGFCLLAFLGDGSTLASGPYRDEVRKGVQWLRTQQLASGAYSTILLEHAIASYAICEAAGLSRSSVLAEEARAALVHLIEHQAPDGGFRYDGKKGRTDEFTTVHGIFALKSGRDFRQLTERAPLRRAEGWLDEPPTRRSAGDLPAVAHGVRSKETAIAARLVSAFFLGRNPNRVPDMMEAAVAILEHKPTEDRKAADQVSWYLSSFGLYQVGGPHWNAWQNALAATLVATQRDDGNFAGSWDPLGMGAMHGGRVYATALSVLTAESYYRYTRLVR